MAMEEPRHYDPVVAVLLSIDIYLHADHQGKLVGREFREYNVFGKKVDYQTWMDCLDYLRAQGILSYRSYLDGLHASYDIKIGAEKTKDFILRNGVPNIVRKIDELNSEIARLKAEKTQLLTFEPDALLIQIAQTKERIHDIKKRVATDELLSSLNKPLEELQDYVNRIERVTNVYSDAYLHIIKPIQIESRKGVKTTVKWAIISIVLATIFSVIATNWPIIWHWVSGKHSQTLEQPLQKP